MEAIGWHLQELVISVKVQFSLEAKALSFPPGEYEGNFETQTSRRPLRPAVKHVV